MTYGEWLKVWQENYLNLTAKQRTIERYTQIINRHIEPKLGSIEMIELTPIHLQKFVTELLRNGNIITGCALASNSVNSIINVMRSSIRTAYYLGYIKDCIADKIKRPKPVEKQVECFSVAEQRLIEKEVFESEQPHLIGIILCLYTGLRLGELLALKWTDIDFSNGLLTVDKSCHDARKPDGTFGRITETPKTASSVRIIPLPKQLRPFLLEIKRKSTSDDVIAKNGKEISVRAYQRNFSAILKKLHIKHHGFHALRHTFATRALECGMDVKTLSEILGHKSPTITLNRYAHSMFDHKKCMMDLVGKTLKM